MDKLTLAHDYVKTILSMNNACHTMDDAVNIGWKYADMMYAEQEKRTSMLDEFQVDWSQAPEWANWFAVDKDGKGHFYDSEPNIEIDEWVYGDCGIIHEKLEGFEDRNDWKDSLQERK